MDRHRHRDDRAEDLAAAGTDLLTSSSKPSSSYDDKISADNFAGEERRLTAQIATLEAGDVAARAEREQLETAALQFELADELLLMQDLDTIWEEATDAERRTLIEDLIDSVCFYPDKITVQVVGAPPILTSLAEVGLRAGTKSVVSKGRLLP